MVGVRKVKKELKASEGPLLVKDLIWVEDNGLALSVKTEEVGRFLRHWVILELKGKNSSVPEELGSCWCKHNRGNYYVCVI